MQDDAQVQAAVAAVEAALGPVIGIYLYGSAVGGGLRPDSDLDLLVVTDRPPEAAARRRLVDALRPISRRASRPAGWRPLEVTVVARPDVRPWRDPPLRQLQYGEWLSDNDLAAQVDAAPVADPDLAVVLTMARADGVALVGPPAADVLDSVPADDLVRCMLDGVPSLMADLAEDTRNVLLTFARIWYTAATGRIASKDEAAAWALPRLADAHRPLLERARELYLTGGDGEWSGDLAAARELADAMVAAADHGGALGT